MSVPFVSESEFWIFEEGQAWLNMDVVARNAIDNMNRISEEATLRVVVDFLRERGYYVEEPEGGHDASNYHR